MGLSDLYRNTFFQKVFPGSALINGATRRSTRIDIATKKINESLMLILSLVASNNAKAAPGTVRLTGLQSPSTNTASYTHIAGSTMRRAGPNTVAATPINATQRYLKFKASVIVGGTNMLMSYHLIGTGRILPLSTK